MNTVKFTLRPVSAFASELQGDMLFGQLCWALRRRQGEAFLRECLSGYTNNRPFLVLSDPMPVGHVPRPQLPRTFFGAADSEADRKARKQRVWLPVKQFNEPIGAWESLAVSAELAYEGGKSVAENRMHNSINRYTGTTGKEFAPFGIDQHWHADAVSWDLYAVLDESRVEASVIHALLTDIGCTGYGRDASTGMGRFEVMPPEPHVLAEQVGANAWLTLAACAPQGQGFDSARSFYQVRTRYGRHGDAAALTGQPFKNPILMAAPGGVFAAASFEPRAFIGQGLGGEGRLSKALEETVHQGYAPVLGIALPPETIAP